MWFGGSGALQSGPAQGSGGAESSGSGAQADGGRSSGGRGSSGGGEERRQGGKERKPQREPHDPHRKFIGIITKWDDDAGFGFISSWDAYKASPWGHWVFCGQGLGA